jgi:hypothetical protein
MSILTLNLIHLFNFTHWNYIIWFESYNAYATQTVMMTKKSGLALLLPILLAFLLQEGSAQQTLRKGPQSGMELS